MQNIANLEIRARVLRQIRAFFDARGFVEVEYAILETDGTLNVILTPAERPVTAGGS